MLVKRMAACLLLAAAAPMPASAQASGPDRWDVTGVAATDVLNLRREANGDSPIVARIPPDAKGLQNLGCTGMATFQQWLRMSAEQRDRMARARWCRVDFKGKKGWVAGRFLAEASGSVPAPSRTASIAAWTVRCAAVCTIEQVGLAGASLTIIRIEPRGSQNAEIIVERTNLPAQGTLSIHMDGSLISSGPIAPLRAKDGTRLVFRPDDIAAGLLRQMASHKSMVLSFPGEDRGVEFSLDRFADARQEAARMAAPPSR